MKWPLLITAASAVVLYLEWASYTESFSPAWFTEELSKPGTAESSAPLMTTGLAEVAPGAYAAITQKTLFRPERVPFVPEASSAPAAAGPDMGLFSQLDLKAIVFVGDVKEIVVDDKQDKKIIRLRVGASIRGWRVKEIRASETIFETAGAEHRLPLRVYPAVGQVSPPSPDPHFPGKPPGPPPR